MEEELTQEEIRAELTAEVFDSVEPTEALVETSQETGREEVEKEPEAEDMWKDINPALKETFDKISSQLESLTTLEPRLKQAERRVGSIQNEVFNAKKTADEAALKAAEAPTEEQIAEASKTKEEWDELKKDFPEWADAIEKKLSATRTELEKRIPDIGEIEGKFTKEIGALSTKITDISMAMEKNVLGIKHPDWEKTITTKEYAEWLAGQAEDVKALTTSKYAKDAIKVLDKFEAQRPTKSAREIAADRKSRLKKSETVLSGKKSKTPKAEADMTDEDYRRLISKEIWDD